MAARQLETTTVELEAGRYLLRATATRTLFDGFSRVYSEGRDEGEEEPEVELPPLREGEETTVLAVEPGQHFTEPPPRYTEASLVKALEEHGIGRPSTYASIVATIIERGYVVVRERRLYPTILGEIVTDLLVGHFGPFVDVGFTARMEEDLDAVAQGRQEWVPVVRSFYEPFRSLVEAKERELRRTDVTSRPTEERCSLGHPMVLRLGPSGPFLGCSLYPEHQETRPAPEVLADLGEDSRPSPGEEAPAEAGAPCPVCGDREGGRLVPRRSRFGPFLGCSRYPACQYVHRPARPADRDEIPEVRCPRCGEGRLVPRRARRSGSRFFGCSRYPACRYTTSATPTGAVHDADDGPIGRRADGGGVCLTCGATVVLPVEETPTALVGRRLPGTPALGEAPVSRRGSRKGRGSAAAEPAGGRSTSVAVGRRAAG
jgi:DNA topoisomerase-1